MPTRTEPGNGVLTEIPWNLLGNLGVGSIVAIAVLGVLRGWLVPGKSLDAMLAVHRERLDSEKARGDEWREVAQTAVARADERDKQTEKLLEVVNTTIALMDTLRRAAEQASAAAARIDAAATRRSGAR